MFNSEHRQSLLERISKIPIFATLGMQVNEIDEGICEVTIPRRLKWDGIFDSLHGGILMTLADSTAAFAILTLTGEQEPMATTDMNIRLLAPCLSDATARAKVIKLGRTMVPVNVEVHDVEGRLVALAQVNYFRLSSGK